MRGVCACRLAPGYLIACVAGVRKSFVGAIVASIALFSWVMYFQLNWRQMPNGKDLLLIIPNEDMDQW